MNFMFLSMSVGQRPGIEPVGQSSSQAVYRVLCETRHGGVNDLGLKFLMSPLEALV